MTSTDWSTSCGPIFMAPSDSVAVQDVVGRDKVEAERLVEAQGRRVGDLRADPQDLRPGDLGGSRDERTGNTATSKRRGDADEVDRHDTVFGAEQLREAGQRALALADDHVVAACSGEEIAGPFGAAAVGDGTRNRRVQMQPRIGKAGSGYRHHRVTVRRAGWT